MYLTIALIVLIPVTVRVYRYLAVKRGKRSLREPVGAAQRQQEQVNVEQR